MALARVRLLDRFCFELDDAPLVLPTALERLVALLALRGPSRRCVVAGTLWPDVSEEHALASLRTSIWRMNRLAPGLLSATGASVAVSAATSVDSREQEEFAIGLLRGQLDDDGVVDGLSVLWGGALLPGWYDDWVMFERDRLQQLRLHALERTAAVLLRRRKVDLALQAALEAVRAEPLRETSNAALISVYLAEGNVVDALRQYDAFRSLIGVELGMVPSPRLVGLLPGHSGDAVTAIGGAT